MMRMARKNGKVHDERVRQQKSRRQIDYASLLLLLVGILSGISAVALINRDGANAVLLIPAVVAGTTGCLNLTKKVATR